VKLKEGYFKLANGVLIRKDFFMREVKRADDLLGNRKSPLKVATILGLGTIFKAVTGTLDVPYIWKMIESRFMLKRTLCLPLARNLGSTLTKKNTT